MKDEAKKKLLLTKGTKIMLDAMFYMGIVVTATLPFTIKWIGQFYEPVKESYEETTIIYFVLGVAALVLIRELRKIFRTIGHRPLSRSAYSQKKRLTR